jgi:Zn-dependent M28 family amino/carboxypeptidase
MRFLADDLLEGRETGTRGYDIAAEYVTAQFTAAGLATSRQPIPFRSAIVKEQTLRAAARSFTPRKDFILYPSFGREVVDVTAPVVLAGFGIVAPEAHHDDYKGVDVRGKVAVVITGAPATFGSEQRAYYSGSALKQRVAAEHGAVGLLLINSRTDEKRVAFERLAGPLPLPSMRYLDADGRPADVSSLQFAGRAGYEAGRALLASSTITLDTVLDDAEKNIPHSLPLSESITVHLVTTFSQAESANVVGILQGTDKRLRNEYVLATAHLDHLGNHDRTGTSKDTIYNGAQDNASGVACLIEIARALAAAPPKRSVVFVALTGEEKGEQGSMYFARNPTVPKDAIVADINMDMPLLLYRPASLIALGGEHSTLGEHARTAAAREHLRITPDPLPEEVRFIRSDQFSFVQQGIPAIHLKTGGSADPAIDANAVTRSWLRGIYHGAADDMSQPMDFAAGAKYAQTNLRLIRSVADSPRRIRWTSGDFFGNLFGPKK